MNTQPPLSLPKNFKKHNDMINAETALKRAALKAREEA